MKKILFLLLLFIVHCDTITSDINSDRQYSIKTIPKKLINANNDFSLDLFCKLNPQDRDGNIFISPVSVSFALGMTMNGADGKTFDELKTTLGFADFDLEKINKTYAALIEELYNASNGVDFNLANSIWYRDDLSLQPEFTDQNEQYFNATIQDLDFSQPTNCKNTVNQWVEKQTKNKIKDFTQESDFNSIMLLINAIYFNAAWKYQFDENDTEKRAFFPENGDDIACEMMQQKSLFKYQLNEHYQAIEIPYANENYVMILIEPKKQNIDEFIRVFDRKNLSDIINNFKKDSVNLTIPKLEIEYEKELSDILKEMGIHDAFNELKADFSKMFNEYSTGVFIKFVRQKSFINLDEEGTEAAAATVVVMDYKGIDEDANKEIYITFDKPFIFFIIEKQSDAILFCGKIINPTL